MDDDYNPDEELGIRNAIREIQSLSLDLVHEATGFQEEMFSSPFDIFDAENGVENLEEIIRKLRENTSIISGARNARIPFYDPLRHSPQDNQEYLIELIEEMRALLIEMQHGEEDVLRDSLGVRLMLLASVQEAKNLLASEVMDSADD